MFTVCMSYKAQTGSYTQPYFFACKPFMSQLGHYLTQRLFIAFTGTTICVTGHITDKVNTARLDRENLVIWFKFEPSVFGKVLHHFGVYDMQKLFAIRKHHDVVSVAVVILYASLFLHDVVKLSQIQICKILTYVVAYGHTVCAVYDVIQQPKEVRVFDAFPHYLLQYAVRY